MSSHSRISQQVRQQYEQFPYPDFDLYADKPQLLVPGHLELMCDLLWMGTKRPAGLRVLDAGCGTGGPLVAMALKYPTANITAIDFSQTSINKAKKLAQFYQVKNIEFYHLSIQELPQLAQTFDFVISSGVLHHLPDPAAGLNAIRQVLDPQGAVSIMVYGKYGRTGIYMVQKALEIMTSHSQTSATPNSQQIQWAYQLAKNVPNHHPMATRSQGREMQEGKHAGIVDLLLHANDIPFDVAAVYRMCREAGMSFQRWLFPLIYNIDNFFNDPFLLNRIKHSGLSRQQQEEMAELAHGNNSKHSFFAVGPDFKFPVPAIDNGAWRHLHAKLTPCMAWQRTTPVPGKKDMFMVPFTIIQDAWGPMEITAWQLRLMSMITPEKSLSEILKLPQVQKELPFKEEKKINREMEQLLHKAMDRLAIVFT